MVERRPSLLRKFCVGLLVVFLPWIVGVAPVRGRSLVTGSLSISLGSAQEESPILCASLGVDLFFLDCWSAPVR